jgi:glucose/mannose-6-phosphate isomerase
MNKMEELIREFPKHIEEATKLAKDISVDGKIDKVLVCGMGGSAIAGDIMSNYTKKIPIFISKTYSIPDFIDNNTLAIISSYSGNTEETIEMFKQARKKTKKIVIITSGGKLIKEKEKKIIVRSGIPPRSSLGYMFFSLLRLLQNSKIIESQDKQVSETTALLRQFDNSMAEQLAKNLQGKIPIIYGSSQYKIVAYRWVTQLNENSKMFAMHQFFPEMNHNEIEALNSKGRLEAVFIRDKEDHPRIKQRMDITQKLLEKQMRVNNIQVKGKSLLARLFYVIHFGDWVSLYSAYLNKVDPVSMDAIERLKVQLKQ